MAKRQSKATNSMHASLFCAFPLCVRPVLYSTIVNTRPVLSFCIGVHGLFCSFPLCTYKPELCLSMVVQTCFVLHHCVRTRPVLYFCIVHGLFCSFPLCSYKPELCRPMVVQTCFVLFHCVRTRPVFTSVAQKVCFVNTIPLITNPVSDLFFTFNTLLIKVMAKRQGKATNSMHARINQKGFEPV